MCSHSLWVMSTLFIDETVGSAVLQRLFGEKVVLTQFDTELVRHVVKELSITPYIAGWGG